MKIYAGKAKFEKERDFTGIMPLLADMAIRAVESIGYEGTGICECGNSIPCIESKSEVFTVMSVLPKLCEKCRAKKYEEYRFINIADQYHAAESRCAGYQNHSMKHIDHYPDMRITPKDGQIGLFNQFRSILDGKTSSTLVYGTTGTGKTYLAKALNNELVKKFRSVCFIKAADLAIFLKKLTYGDDYRKILKDFKAVDVLIVDDFGIHKATDVVKEMIFSILESRYENRKTTIITTNLNREAMEGLDPRLASRIYDKRWMNVFNLIGYDMRTDDCPF